MQFYQIFPEPERIIIPNSAITAFSGSHGSDDGQVVLNRLAAPVVTT
jgi:hypothetical protein